MIDHSMDSYSMFIFNVYENEEELPSVFLD